MSMDIEESKFVQSAPDLSRSKGDVEEKQVERIQMESRTSGWGRALRSDEIHEDADAFFMWLLRYPVERNHPRPTTGAITVKKAGDAVVCTPDERLESVLKKLIVEGFLSMPILSSTDHRLIGYIDMLDIVWFVLFSFGLWAKGEGRTESRAHFESYLKLERFRNAIVADVMGRSGFGTRNQPHHTYKGFSLFHVFESQARLSIHRMAICNSERKVTGLITQSMIISLLDQHLDKMGGLAQTKVDAMVPGLGDLHVISDREMAVSAFRMMTSKNVSGLAVVNDAGHLIDTISVRDLRGMGIAAEDWMNLWMSIAEFKLQCRAKFPSQTPSVPLYVKKSDTLATVIKKMDDGNIHRIFVCEPSTSTPSACVPTHCISQRDVLRFLLHLGGLKSTVIEDLQIAEEVL